MLDATKLCEWVLAGVHGFNKSEIKELVRRAGNEIIVSNDYYYKAIEMKDKWWWIFIDKTWEGEVRKAIREAQNRKWECEKEEQIKDHQLSKFKEE